MQQEALHYKAQKDSTMYTLDLKDYQNRQREMLEEDKKYRAISATIPQMNVFATTAESLKMAADTNEAKMEKAWLKNLTKDPELYEATRVIDDMKQ